MPDYQQGKIYRLVCSTTGKVYYGSTTKTYLSQRLAGHVSSYKVFLEGKGHNVSSFQVLENKTYKMILVESFPCKSKDELQARERFYIENNECVNKCVPTRTEKQWRDDNKDRVLERDRAYYQKNRDKIIEQRRVYYVENKSTKLERDRKNYEKNKDKIKEKQKLYFQTNREKIKIKRQETYRLKQLSKSS